MGLPVVAATADERCSVNGEGGGSGSSAAESTQRSLKRLATRGPVASEMGVGAVLSKDGTKMRRIHRGREEETMVLGGACSEVFSGPRLAKVLRPAVEHQRAALAALEAGEPCSPLSIHTSAGIPAALGGFVEALEPHLPWPQEEDDWFLNLQVEGTTAVWAGVEALMALQKLGAEAAGSVQKSFVGVAATSYHGPSTTGLGQPAQPRWPGAPRSSGQLPYPVPGAEVGDDEATQQEFLARFSSFLDEHDEKIGVFLFEPQWGSSQAARPWPEKLLRQVIAMSRRKGALVLCDEIMCGLGRHGQGTLFLSKAWGLEPDAVTFGKAVASGAFPLSGVALRRGAAKLKSGGVKLVQSHTFAASSALAMMTATQVINELPHWFGHAARLGSLFDEVLGPVCDDSFCQLRGTGLMWGGSFPEHGQLAMQLLQDACTKEGAWPYFLPRGGFMITPPMDTDEAQLREGLLRLRRALATVKARLPAAGSEATC